jgi:SPP1 family holin
MKIKITTIIRAIALIAVLVNQILAIFGKGLPLSENMMYQIISAVLTVGVAVWAAWKNNDFTKFAVLAGSVLSALKDGKITEEEVEAIVTEATAVIPNDNTTTKNTDENDGSSQK